MKDIPSYEDLYSIDENGNVFSYRKQKFLKPSIDKNGYLGICLYDLNGKYKHYRIHRLAALTYVPNPYDLPEVDHIDRNRLNNSVENLRWVTRQENISNRDCERIRENMRKIYFNIPEEIRKEWLQKACQSSIQARLRPVEMRDKNNHNIIIKTYPSATQAAIQEFDDVKKQGNISACARGKRQSAYGYFWTFALTNADVSCDEEN